MYYDDLVPHFANKGVQEAFFKSVSSIVDKNTEILSQNGFYSKIEINQIPLNQLVPIDDSEFKKAMASFDFVYNTTVFREHPFYFKSMLPLKYYVETKNQRMTLAVLMYLTLRTYGAIYVKYFTVGYAKKEVMEYVINNLSFKYDIKKLGTLQKTLEKLTTNNHENYLVKLASDEDEDIYKYIEGLRTRMNALVKNVYSEFKDAYDNKKYMNVDKVSATNDDNEEFDIERNTNSSSISKASSSFSFWFSVNAIDSNGLNIAKGYVDLVSESNLAKILYFMKNDRSNRLENLMNGIFGMVLDATNKSTLDMVCNRFFIVLVLTIFNKTNSSDQNIIMIKDNIEYFVREVYGDVKETLQLRYRKALLAYLSFAIQKQRCS